MLGEHQHCSHSCICSEVFPYVDYQNRCCGLGKLTKEMEKGEGKQLCVVLGSTFLKWQAKWSKYRTAIKRFDSESRKLLHSGRIHSTLPESHVVKAPIPHSVYDPSGLCLEVSFAGFRYNEWYILLICYGCLCTSSIWRSPIIPYWLSFKYG